MVDTGEADEEDDTVGEEVVADEETPNAHAPTVA